MQEPGLGEWWRASRLMCTLAQSPFGTIRARAGFKLSTESLVRHLLQSPRTGHHRGQQCWTCGPAASAPPHSSCQCFPCSNISLQQPREQI